MRRFFVNTCQEIPMAQLEAKILYTGSVTPVTLGAGAHAVVVGGETSYPFHLFEGAMPNRPKIALEVVDTGPGQGSAALDPVFGDATGDPVAWAKKAASEHKPDLICLTLTGTDPNGRDDPPEKAVRTVQAVLSAVDVPLVVWGSGNETKDAAVLKAVAEQCQKTPLALGPVTDGNYKQVGASALAYGHVVIASTPIDINLAKQLNILLENLGIRADRILIDPTVGGLGYGFEYTYSVMERIRIAGLAAGDEKLRSPLFCHVAGEVWKTKEARLTKEEAPLLGDTAARGVLLEAMTAQGMLLAGADILVLRHPETARLISWFMDETARQ
jgi:acetyl-CoA decarbonylase/synthase, CODH/ACS complex subunit delta